MGSFCQTKNLRPSSNVMLTRPFKIIPQSDEGTLGPGSTGWLSPGDCPGVSIQSGVPWASAPFSISCDASFLSEPTLGFRGAELPLPEVGIQEIFREVKVSEGEGRDGS